MYLQQPRTTAMNVLTPRRFRRNHEPAAHGSPDPQSARQVSRAALVVNPYSSGMTSRREREIVALLREHMSVDVLRTERPGHAPDLVRQACDDGVDVVIACGGDGTANEVLNGMQLGERTATTAPAFALIPAGGTNVFCRSLGLPNQPVHATRILARIIAQGQPRTINLGQLDERIFLFAAGIGMDGEMVKRIEMRRKGRRPSDLAHATTVVGMFASERFALGDRMTVRIDDTGEELRSCLVMCGNTTPMTYIGRLAINFLPDCSLDTGLDFLAPTSQNARQAIASGMRALGMLKLGDTARSRLGLHHDVTSFTIECDEPQACQTDGEYIGDRTHIALRSLPEAVQLFY